MTARFARQCGVVLAMVLTLCATLPAAQSSAGPSNPCQSNLVLAMYGSGETYSAEYGSMGRTLFPVEMALLDKANADSGNTFSSTGVSTDYTAASVDLLLKGSWRDRYWNIQRYVASMNDGAAVLYTALDLRAKKCPNENIVLLGYSQGAMAIRLALRNLDAAKETSILRRISVVGLVADGFKQPNEPNFGDAPPSSSGIAQVLGKSVKLPDQVAGRVFHLRAYRDVVCDANHIRTFTDSAKVHTTYSENVLKKFGESLVPAALNPPRR